MKFIKRIVVGAFLLGSCNAMALDLEEGNHYQVLPESVQFQADKQVTKIFLSTAHSATSMKSLSFPEWLKTCHPR